MGYCIDGDDRFDVFLSYARVDDEATNHWISDFERYLKEKVAAELARNPDAERERAHLVRICRDKTGFPPSGKLTQIIDQYVRNSHTLFIFLGSGYIQSDWCLSELDIFRQASGGDLSDALKRLYLIVLDKEALNALTEGGALSPKREREVLWKQLQGVTTSAVRIEDFLKDDDLVPVYREEDHADPGFHIVARRIVKDLVEKLVAGRRATQSHTLDQPEVGPRTVVIGAVPPQLANARDALVRALSGIQVHVIEIADLRDPHKMQAHMEGLVCFVLPFDKSAPIGSEILPGGHLARQREQFEKLRTEGRVSPDASLIWWNPVPSEKLTGQPLADADDSFLKEIDSLPEPHKRSCSVEELSVDLLDRMQSEVVTAKVWIDWVEKDNQTIEQAKKEVKARFNAYCQRRAAGSVPFTPKLTFLTADWQKLAFKLSKRKKPDGVVIVYNEYKDFEALEAESEVISEDPEVLHHRMLPGIFYLHPNGMYKPDDDWIFVRFLRKNSELSYDPDELEQFVAGLFRVIAKKHPHLGLGGQA